MTNDNEIAALPHPHIGGRSNVTYASMGGGYKLNVTERDRGVGGLLLRYVTQGCQHMNKWIY